MSAADSGFELTDLTHASALLLGISLGVYATLKIMRAVFDFVKEDDDDESG